MEDSAKTLTWWRTLCAVSVLNVALWGLSLWWDPPATPHRAQHIVYSAVFVAVCAFRSFYPRVDLERTVLRDSPLSSIALGRSLATVAEMSFVAQCALVLHDLAGAFGVPLIDTLASTLVPMIAIAQMACWYAVLTLDHLWHAVEEILWTVMVAVVALCLVLLAPHTGGLLLALFVVGGVSCAGAAVLMAGIDVPMYFRRRRECRAEGLVYLSVADGARDALHTRRPTLAWTVWRHEVPWMSLYFSFGVWLSLVMGLLESTQLP